MTLTPPAMYIDEDRLRELFVGMVNIYSPSGKEGEICAFVEEHASRMGLPFLRQYVNDTRYNLLVGPPLSDVSALLVGHLDTVPAYDLEQYGVRCEGDEVFGLGTADMKGGCAAILEAMAAYVDDCARLPSAALCLVVGEEETGDGAMALVKEWKGDAVVFVAEPTAMQPATSHYGYAELELVAVGERRHAAMANRERNAIFAVLQALLHVSDFVEKNYPRTILNIRDMHSSEAGFAVADRCRACIDLHMPPDLPFLDSVDVIAQHIRECAEDPEHLQITVLTADSGWVLPEDCLAVKLGRAAALSSGVPWHDAPFRSHSDASVFARAGAQPLLLGPGLISKAHTRNESVPWTHIVRAARFYRALLHLFDDNR